MAHWPAMLPCCWNKKQNDEPKRATETDSEPSTDPVPAEDKNPDEQRPRDEDLNADW